MGYLGIRILFISKEDLSGTTTASLDRKNPTIGYIEGNVWWIHKHINQMKWQFGTEYFLSLCNNISEYNR